MIMVHLVTVVVIENRSDDGHCEAIFNCARMNKHVVNLVPRHPRGVLRMRVIVTINFCYSSSI